MTFYSNQNGTLSEIKEKPFRLEKDIQKVVEKNLQQLMQLHLVKSEFSIKNKRIDTLAFDQETHAFVIIEYKRDKNISVIDQGFTYLSLMLENKADFILEYNEGLKPPIKRDDVDWSQTRVVFISSSFTENQVQATNFKDIALELWEVKQYENNSVFIHQLKKSTSAESIKPVTQKNKKLKKITDEIRIYTEEDLLSKGCEGTQELYLKFKYAIINLSDDIEAKAVKLYMVFKKKKNIASIVINKKHLHIYIDVKSGKLDDPKKLAQDVSGIGHWATGNYRVHVEDDSQLEYIMSLIKQAIL